MVNLQFELHVLEIKLYQTILFQLVYIIIKQKENITFSSL